MGCDLPGLLVYLPAVISIHAPTWGATRRSRRMRTRFRLFQSTHPRGVRLREDGFQGFVCEFQSTHPRGVRQCVRPKSCCSAYFNPRTHVGCDVALEFGGDMASDFNPRTHVGCDSPTTMELTNTDGFQSTHPRGVRRFTNMVPLTSTNFNPRTHVGCDAEAVRDSDPLCISIHAPTWGATAIPEQI